MKRRALLRNVEPPSIYIALPAYLKIMAMVELCKKEVGWMGSVEQQGDEYVIYDVYLFDQDVTPTETDIDAESIAKIGMELLNDGKEKEVAEMRFWGHSHVNMGVTPSGQDLKQAIEFMDYPGVDYYICGIFNKKKEIRMDFYDFKNREVWEELPTTIGDPAEIAARYADIQSQIDLHVKERATIIGNRNTTGVGGKTGVNTNTVNNNAQSGNLQSVPSGKDNSEPFNEAKHWQDYYDRREWSHG